MRMIDRISSRRRFSAWVGAARQQLYQLRRPASASTRLSRTVWFSNTVGFWNFRPMPSVAMSASSSLVRSALPSKNTSPASGRVLPVMTSIIVVLPAPLGPMMARISPGSTSSERLFRALKPSKETVTPLEIEQRRGGLAGRVHAGPRARSRALS